jgi:broad specificity phosphatase PhoE
VLHWLEEVATCRSVLAITHGGTIDFLYRMATGVAVHGGPTIFAASNASVSIFDVRWPRIALVGYDVPIEEFSRTVGSSA